MNTIQHTSYDLSNRTELLAFTNNCVKAEHHCPQVKRPSPIDGYSKNNPITASQVFIIYFKSSILWSHGYHKKLNTRTKATFNRYAILRNGKVFDTELMKYLD